MSEEEKAHQTEQTRLDLVDKLATRIKLNPELDSRKEKTADTFDQNMRAIVQKTVHALQLIDSDIYQSEGKDPTSLIKFNKAIGLPYDTTFFLHGEFRGDPVRPKNELWQTLQILNDLEMLPSGTSPRELSQTIKESPIITVKNDNEVDAAENKALEEGILVRIRRVDTNNRPISGHFILGLENKTLGIRGAFPITYDVHTGDPVAANHGVQINITNKGLEGLINEGTQQYQQQ